jgi:hypothetical protein
LIHWFIDSFLTAASLIIIIIITPQPSFFLLYHSIIYKTDMNSIETINKSPPSCNRVHDDRNHDATLLNHKERCNADALMDASHAMLTLRDTPIMMPPCPCKNMITPSPPAVVVVGNHPHRLEIESLMELRRSTASTTPTTPTIMPTTTTTTEEKEDATTKIQQQQQQHPLDPMQHYQQTIAYLQQIKKNMEQEHATVASKLQQAKKEMEESSPFRPIPKTNIPTTTSMRMMMDAHSHLSQDMERKKT